MVPTDLKWEHLEVLGAARLPSMDGRGFAIRNPIVRVRERPTIAFVLPDVAAPVPCIGNLINESELREGFDSGTLILTESLAADPGRVLVVRGVRFRNAVDGMDPDLSWHPARNAPGVDYAYAPRADVERWRDSCRRFLRLHAHAKLRKCLKHGRGCAPALALAEEGTFACDVGTEERLEFFSLIGVAVRGDQDAWLRLQKIVRFEFPAARDFDDVRAIETALRSEPVAEQEWGRTAAPRRPPRFGWASPRKRARAMA